jgi:segregation and condensation protein B
LTADVGAGDGLFPNPTELDAAELDPAEFDPAELDPAELDPADAADIDVSQPETVPEPEIVPEHDLAGALEAVLLVVEAPVPESALAAAVGHRPARVRELLLDLVDRYTAVNSGIELRELGGGWRFYTRDRFAPIVERFVLDGAQSRLSKAALETLAVVAYRQPVTRARVAAVRGVNVDGVVRTLMSRGLIEDVGTDPDTGGLQYRTTDLLLERLGLSDLSELPSLGPLLPDIEGIDDV